MAAAAIIARANSTVFRRQGSSNAPQDATWDMPAEDTWLKGGVLQKRIVNESISWGMRNVVLTKDEIAVGRHEDAKHVIESIELKEVEEVLSLEVRGEDVTQQKDTTHGSQSQLYSSALNQVSSHSFRQRNPSVAIEILTKHEGWHRGKKYIFGIPNHGDLRAEKQEAEEWVFQIEEAKSKLRAEEVNTWAQFQARAKSIYHSTQTQMTIALIIFANFGLSVVEAQLVPEEDTKLFDDLEKVDLAFTCIFTMELLFNMLGSWFHDFWAEGWNVFDFVIVSVSILSYVLTDVPGLSLLRMMRVFRVIRVFKRLKALKKVVKAVAKAVVPVLNAFGVLSIVTCMYAVIAVQLYSDHEGANGNFQNFAAAIFTMFQVCTSDGWATDVVRPMFGPEEGTVPEGAVALFFVSYMLVVHVVLLNVVIAVLLDEFITSVAQDKAAERTHKLGTDDVNEQSSVLDPLLATLMSFNTSKDLSARIKAIYQVLDSDDSGGLSYAEFADGVRRLRTQVPIVLSLEDFNTVTEDGALCEASGELSLAGFEAMIRRQLALFAQRRIASQMAENDDNQAVATMLFALKQLTLGVEITGMPQADLDSIEPPGSTKRERLPVRPAPGSALSSSSASSARNDPKQLNPPPPATDSPGPPPPRTGAGESVAMAAFAQRLSNLDSKVDRILSLLDAASQPDDAAAVDLRGGAEGAGVEETNVESFQGRAPRAPLRLREKLGGVWKREGAGGGGRRRREPATDLIAAASALLHLRDGSFHEQRAARMEAAAAGHGRRRRSGVGADEERGAQLQLETRLMRNSPVVTLRPPGANGAAEEQVVRVWWAGDAPQGHEGGGGGGSSGGACGGCGSCCGGFVNVGCLLCGEQMVLISATGALPQGWVPRPGSSAADQMAMRGQALLREHGKLGKVVDPTRYVDSPHADRRHMYRCYIIEDR